MQGKASMRDSEVNVSSLFQEQVQPNEKSSVHWTQGYLGPLPQKLQPRLPGAADLGLNPF